MAKKPEMPNQIRFWTDMNMDGDTIGFLSFSTGQGLTQFAINRNGAETILQMMTNFIDIDEGRPPSFPQVMQRFTKSQGIDGTWSVIDNTTGDVVVTDFPLDDLDEREADEAIDLLTEGLIDPDDSA